MTVYSPSSKGIRRRLGRDFVRHRSLYLMFLPVLAYFIVFSYWPMYGIQIAFKNYQPGLSFWESEWVGFRHFQRFFSGIYFTRTLRNTLLISLYDLLFGFPAPILLALFMNELRSSKYKRAVQTISYLPHFISMVVLCGMIRSFTAKEGLINDIVEWFGGTRATLLMQPGLFRSVYTASGIWQNIGWNTIIYLAAISGVDPELYDAATVDGASRFRRLVHITLPGIGQTVVILLVLRIGSLMSVGSEKILLLYSPATMDTADTISTYVYRKGLQEFSYSFSAAVGLFNSVINFTLLVFANTVSRRLNDLSLW
ncbi:MAG TPA: ABC transporter permease subunit [Clostridia bacterium]|nr:ABC transporter permease subunit [Clostridia bacterium]